jgi:hypothetical protein
MSGKRSLNRPRKRLQIKFESQAGSGMGFTENISAGGLLLHSNLVCPPGTLLRGTIQLGAQELRFDAEVRWARKTTGPLAQFMKNSMGLRFVTPPDERFYQLLSPAK